MNIREAHFGRRILSNTSYALVDQILAKVGTTAAFILLVRLLPSADITAIGVGMGYLVVLSYVNIDLIRILLRDYPKIASDRTERDRHLTAYLVFWWLQTGVLLLLAFALQVLVFDKLNVPGLSFLFIGMTIDLAAVVFQDWIKMVFYTELQQSFATKIGLFSSFGRLACFGILFFSPTLDTYTWVLIGTSIANCVIWGIAFQKRFHFRLIFMGQIPGIVKHTLTDYALWDHFNRTSIDTLLTVDTLVLSLCGQLKEIGNYAIALKFTSMLFLIPWQINRSLQVVISNCGKDSERFEAINTFLKANTIISVSQLIFVMMAGNWIINLLFGGNTSPEVLRFTMIITVGATVMNLGWPLCAVINNTCSLRQAFLTIFLPGLTIGLTIYIGATALWGAIGTAYANVAVYASLLIILIIFTKQHCPFPLNLQWITHREKEILQGLVRGLT